MNPSIPPPSTLIWLPSPSTVWKSVVLVSYSPSTQLLQYSEKDSPTVHSLTLAPSSLFPLNPSILIGQNDLTALSYLHEPAVLHNLSHRFSLNTIYTYCGIVLVAINPYEELDIYNRETILAYRGAGAELDPHIFAVAEAAFSKMERDSLNQSIIVSGESGAGKTVSAKYAMRYFATVGGCENETQIEHKVLASSPIMEAIGNAKTNRNDNSSRFGKYIELHFSSSFSITAASMRTYLLEKSRVVYQSPGERNYHIFYQITTSSHSELSELFLEPPQHFHYTRQGQASSTADAAHFSDTVASLTLLGFGLDNRRNFFKVLAALLQLGNVEFKPGGSEEALLAKDSPALDKIVQLLGLDGDKLRLNLTTRLLTSGSERITKKLSLPEAAYSRDALAKLIYSELFNWVVGIVNTTLLAHAEQKKYKFIGVLDIYGFETFEVNSFEQFCINYANEKLQQQFNQHVFKLEQEEYIREGISWTMIDFYDNQPCIDLIESKLGILDLLDEECKLGSGSDGSWVLKLHKTIVSPHYVKPKIDSDRGFVIKHFADDVGYSCGGFIEKNRDLVGDGVVGVVGENPFLSAVLAAKLTNTKELSLVSKSTQRKAHPTVGSSFRSSLTLLMTSLNLTTPHYVRCIKPNDSKLPFVFDPHRAVQQLRACGVLETIRISAAGYPSRWSYAEFYARYRMCQKRAGVVKGDYTALSVTLIGALIQNEDNYRLGKTKIFFRAGQVAYLERLRLERLQWAGLIIQKWVKMWAKKNSYRKVRRSAGGLQRWGRGLLARRHALHLRQTRAAITIQSHFRGFLARQEFKSKMRVILLLQTRARGFLARAHARTTRTTAAVTKIQAFFRGILTRRAALASRRRTVLAQSCIRRYLAKKRLRGLKLEARSLAHVQQTNKGLENKIISLQQRIEGLNKEVVAGGRARGEVERLKQEVAVGKTAEKEAKLVRARLLEVELEVQELKSSLAAERAEKVDLAVQNEKLALALERDAGQLANQAAAMSDLRAKILELEKQVNEQAGHVERAALLEVELDAERRKYREILVEREGDAMGVVVPVPRARTHKQPEPVEGGNNLDLETSLTHERTLHSQLLLKYNQLLSSSSSQVLAALTQENQQLKKRAGAEEEPESFPTPNFSVVKKKNVTYLGMLEYKQEDLDRILRALITDLPPSLAISITPTKSLPAYLLFMMIRYTDYLNDDERVRALLTKAINAVKRLVRKRGGEEELLILWLANLTRLLHTLKQYCGDAGFQADNTPRQNEQCLKNFDLVEYRQVLSDHSVWVYTLLIKNLEDCLQSLIVPALLESSCDPTSTPNPTATATTKLDTLLSKLDRIHCLLSNYGLDPSLTGQIFKQLFYYVTAGALNNLLLRRELCHWSKGVDIRFNISGVEEWTRTKHLDPSTTSVFAPLIQASQVLQARKTDKDAGTLVEICADLSVNQVIKLLNLYSSKDGLDSDKVSPQLITLVQEKLTAVRKDAGGSLLMDTKFSFNVNFDYCPSGVSLEEIVVPDGFGIGGWVKML